LAAGIHSLKKQKLAILFHTADCRNGAWLKIDLENKPEARRAEPKNCHMRLGIRALSRSQRYW
jgi:hypothetical protein